MTEPSGRFDVVSAFVDDEPFDPAALARALAEPEGRQQLIEFIALRHVVADEGGPAAAPAVARTQARGRSRWPILAGAAAVILALAGGFLVGRTLDRSDRSNEAPAPTRTIELRPGVEWQITTGGR